jgi:uncharacterized protein
VRIILSIAAFAAAITAARAAPVASFDCAKAISPEEKLICSNDELAALDAQLSSLFGKLMAAANPDEAAAIRANQRDWLKARGPCFGHGTSTRVTPLVCAKDIYRRRIAQLLSGTLLVCTKAEAGRVTLTCKAPTSPRHFTFVLTGSTGDGDIELSKLVVTRPGGKPQEIKVEGRIFSGGFETAIELTDVNFDGHPDIKLWTATSAGPNMGYDYWLYNPGTGSFDASGLGELLSGSDITVDPTTKTIAVNGRNNCCSWNNTTYAWRGGSLYAIRSSDAPSFTPANLPGAGDETLCGQQTKHFDNAGRITRIDIALDDVKSFDPKGDNLCDRKQLAAQGKLLDRMKAKPGSSRIEAKDAWHFTIVFDKAVKDRD